MSNVPKMFGSLVFNETVMKDRLPTATYKTFKNAVLKGEALDLPIANIIANADERLGAGTWRDPFYPLVPADDRYYCRKA